MGPDAAVRGFVVPGLGLVRKRGQGRGAASGVS